MANIHLAASAGFCFGVARAIDIAKQTAGERKILGDLVHNPLVVQQLAAAGAEVVQSLDQVPQGKVVITAHGIPDSTIAAAKAKGLEVVNTTCPLVGTVYYFVRKFEAEGYEVVVVGNPNHVEVKGIVGNVRSAIVVQKPEDVAQLRGKKVGVVSQTTNEPAYFKGMVEQIKQVAAEMVFQDTICFPTKDRQRAAIELAQEVQVMIVIGGRKSANTKHLHEICGRHTVSHWIEFPDELQPEWFKGVQEIGVTAGASTPEELIDATISRIRTLTS